MKEKKDPTILEAFLSLVLLIFLRYNLRFPLTYKRESRAPHEGDRIDSSQIRTNPSNPEHTVEQQPSSLSTRLLLSSETWGMSLSRPFVTPTTNFRY